MEAAFGRSPVMAAGRHSVMLLVASCLSCARRLRERAAPPARTWSSARGEGPPPGRDDHRGYRCPAVPGIRQVRLGRDLLIACSSAFPAREDEYLRYTADPRVPFDNYSDVAEREIRMSKLRIKVSGCMRSTAGAEAFCAIRSCLFTAAFSRGRDPQRRSDPRVCAAQRLIVRTLPCA